MKRYIGFLLIIFLFSCNHNEKMLLPKAEKTIVKEMVNHSPVFMFFRTAGKDTLIKVNKNGTISTTNWIFNIDKRLPLRLVIPEVIKLQQKKETSVHQDLESQNYYSYADSVGKSLAFLPFTNVKYTIGKAKFGVKIRFTKNQLFIDDALVEKSKFEEFVNHMKTDKSLKYFYCFDKNMSFDDYLKIKVFVYNLKLPNSKNNSANEEFID